MAAPGPRATATVVATAALAGETFPLFHNEGKGSSGMQPLPVASAH